MPYLIFIALVAFVIILVGGFLVSLVKYLPASQTVRKVVQSLIASLTLAALIFLVLIPLIRELKG